MLLYNIISFHFIYFSSYGNTKYKSSSSNEGGGQ